VDLKWVIHVGYEEKYLKIVSTQVTKLFFLRFSTVKDGYFILRLSYSQIHTLHTSAFMGDGINMYVYFSVFQMPWKPS